MNNLRKIAWFNLKVLAVGVSLGLLIIAVSLAAGGVVGVVVAYAGFLVISIAVLITVPGRLLLLVRKKSGRVNFDERDDAIEKKSQLISHFLLSVIFLGTCLIAIPPPRRRRYCCGGVGDTAVCRIHRNFSSIRVGRKRK